MVKEQSKILKIDRTESFDDYFPCRKERSCKLKNISNWFRMFIDMHNRSIVGKLPTKSNTVGNFDKINRKIYADRNIDIYCEN